MKLSKILGVKGNQLPLIIFTLVSSTSYKFIIVGYYAPLHNTHMVKVNIAKLKLVACCEQYNVERYEMFERFMRRQYC